ncbi:NAD-dependent epimerase/dehydratase family protein, partial [Actinocorallia aurantiaca]
MVTGSAGFVGRHMVAELERRGWDVDGVDVSSADGWRGLDALEVFRFHQVRYDLVVHCAARSPHRAAIDAAPSMMAYNLQLDAAMFDWAVRTHQGRVLYLSSSAVYPAGLQRQGAPWLPLEEDLAGGDQIGFPADSYGWTKLTGERMAAA